MCRALIIGAGGVGTVVTQKIAANPVFSGVMLASRTKSKCDAVAAAIGGNRVKTAQVDADNVPELCELFRAFNLKKDAFLQQLTAVRGNQRVTSDTPEDTYEALAKYGTDLVRRAREQKMDPVIGRDTEIRRVLQILSRRTKNNPVLIGEPGVGKTAIAEGLARRIVNGDVPESMRNKRIVSLNIGSMLAGAKYRGEFEERLKSFLKEVTDSNGEIILFIDELHTIVGAGASEGAVDASNLLKPALARGELRTIGATTLDEYRKYIEKDAALERRFQPVMVSEPSVEDTIAILRGLNFEEGATAVERNKQIGGHKA